MQSLSLTDIKSRLANGALTLESLTQHYLDQIDAKKDLNIYVNVFASEALNRAKVLDEKYNTDPESVGKLFGVVISIKDVICYKDHPVSAGSKMLSNFESIYNSTVVERLMAEDAIIIGSTNCDEFAMGSSNEHSYYGPTKNADNPDYIPGGSSGGAAVSVQADTCLLALGSDTGGSVRQPAAHCGIIGMKPSYGRISRHGIIAYASSFDQIGILGRHTADIALVLEVIAGRDEYDSTVSQEEVPAYSEQIDADKKYKVGVLNHFFEDEKIDDQIRTASMDMIQRLKDSGVECEEVAINLTEYLVPTYYVLTTAEASSNLSRYDGVKYGHRADNISDLETLYKSSRTEGFGMEVKRRIMLGTFVLSSGYYDAYFEKAQKLRQMIKEEIDRVFEKVDIILLPVSLDFPWKIGDTDQDPVTVYLSDVCTVIANICGIPGLSYPICRNAENLSAGIQVLSKKHTEQDLINFSRQLEILA